jgi:integrase
VQEAIADRRPLPIPDGKAEHFYKHPTIPSFYLRQYKSGKGKWQLQYRVKATGEKRTLDCGDADVTTLVQAEKKANAARQRVADGEDPQGEKREQRDKAKSNPLTIARIKRVRPDLLERIEAKELSVTEAAAEAGIGPKPTVGELCEEYFQDMEPVDSPLSPTTLQQYKYLAKLLGPLRGIVFDELLNRRNDITARLRQIEKDHSQHVMFRFRSMLSSTYEWAKDHYPDNIQVNPVAGTGKRARRKPKGEEDMDYLSMHELGAIWRACEAMEANAVATFKGNAWGGAKAVPANSIRDRSALLTTAEAARQSGLHKSILYRAIEAGELKPRFRRDLSEGHSANHPLKITRGKGHGSDFLIEFAELDQFMKSRNGLVRSPQLEYSVVIRLLAFLGLRYSQIAELRWSELGEWDYERDRFIPSSSISVLRQMPRLADGRRRFGMKAHGGEGPKLIRYLPPLAVELINKMERKPGEDLIFGGGPRGIRENGRYKNQLDAIILANEGKAIIHTVTERQKDGSLIQVERLWHLHMLRHSFITHLKGMGAQPWIVSAMVNHASADGSPTTRGYDHQTYMEDQPKWMDSWVAKLLNEAHGVKDDQTNVAQFPRAETA